MSQHGCSHWSSGVSNCTPYNVAALSRCVINLNSPNVTTLWMVGSVLLEHACGEAFSYPCSSTHSPQYDFSAFVVVYPKSIGAEAAYCKLA